MDNFLFFMVLIFTWLLSGHVYELFLIDNCVKEGTLKTWSKDYTFECKATKVTTGVNNERK